MIAVFLLAGLVSAKGEVILLGISVSRLGYYDGQAFEAYCESLGSSGSSSISVFSIVSFLLIFLLLTLGDICGIGDSAFNKVVVVL